LKDSGLFWKDSGGSKLTEHAADSLMYRSYKTAFESAYVTMIVCANGKAYTSDEYYYPNGGRYRYEAEEGPLKIVKRFKTLPSRLEIVELEIKVKGR
jgi:hypothetical protein